MPFSDESIEEEAESGSEDDVQVKQEFAASDEARGGLVAEAVVALGRLGAGAGFSARERSAASRSFGVR